MVLGMFACKACGNESYRYGYGCETCDLDKLFHVRTDANPQTDEAFAQMLKSICELFEDKPIEKPI
jgi:hypothetical protein